MTDASILELSTRLARLEGRHRRLRRLVAMGALGVIAVALMAQAPAKGPRTLEAERFVLRDSAGRVRANLKVEELTQFAVLELLDGNNRQITSLWVSADGKPGLTLDQRHHAEAELFEITAGSLRVGALGRNYVVVHTSKAGDPYIKVVGQRSEAVLGRTELTQTRTGGTEIRPAASLVLFDKDGKVTWSAPP